MAHSANQHRNPVKHTKIINLPDVCDVSNAEDGTLQAPRFGRCVLFFFRSPGIMTAGLDARSRAVSGHVHTAHETKRQGSYTLKTGTNRQPQIHAGHCKGGVGGRGFPDTC